MPITCHKDPDGLSCAREKVSPQTSTEAEQWLNMMTSMLNFAMASTTLMKSIQTRVEVTKKLEDEARTMRAAEFFRQELAKSMPEKGGVSEDFSLRSAPIREDTCAQNTCILFFKDEPDECGPECEGKRPPPPIKPGKKKKTCYESVDTIGGSCLCLIPVPEEPPEPEPAEEPDDLDICSCEMLKACMVQDDDDESCICGVKSDDKSIEEDTKVCEPQHACPANGSIDDSDNCSCPSVSCKEAIVEPDECHVKIEEKPTCTPPPAPPVVIPPEPEHEESIVDCGCQTASWEKMMVKELQMANLAYQLRQTDKNLKELKREMDRISTFVGGKKKCSYAKAAALYEEIMKPRTSLDEVNKPGSSRRRRH